MRLELKYRGDPILRMVSKKIDMEAESNLNELIESLKELVNSKKGVGLAAPQVGILKRLIIIKDMDTNVYYEMINPELIWTSFDKEYGLEGCLSVIDKDGNSVYDKVWRFKRIRVKWLDKDGNIHEKLFKNNLESRIIQHEIDHLDGKLFLDYIV